MRRWQTTSSSRDRSAPTRCRKWRHRDPWRAFGFGNRFLLSLAVSMFLVALRAARSDQVLAHNEVIGFERTMVQLTSERDEAVAGRRRPGRSQTTPSPLTIRQRSRQPHNPPQSGHVGPLRCCLHGPLIGPHLLRQERDARSVSCVRRGDLNRQVRTCKPNSTLRARRTSPSAPPRLKSRSGSSDPRVNSRRPGAGASLGWGASVGSGFGVV